MRISLCSVVIGAACFVAACSTSPRQTVLVSLDRVDAASQVTLPSDRDLPDADQFEDEWWNALDDTVLRDLVARGLDQSLDIADAGARLDEADAVLRAARAPLWPGLSLTSRSTDGGAGQTVTEIGGRLGWQIDLFGSNRLAKNAAQSRRDAADASADDVRRTVASNIVALYIGIRATQADLSLSDQSAKRMLEAEDKISRLTQSGYAVQLDVERAKRQRLDVEARNYRLRGQLVAQLNALALLVGDVPGGVQLPDLQTPFPESPPKLAKPNVPEIFARRPDLRSAHANLIAAAKDAAVARRSVLPSLDLSLTRAASDAGRSALSFGDFQSNIVLDIASPILFRGQHLAEIDGADARLARAAIAYEKTALTVLAEIDTALAETQTLSEAANVSQESRMAAEKALEQSDILFGAGEVAYLDVLLAKQAQIEADRNVLALRRDALLAWARFMSAQGG